MRPGLLSSAALVAALAICRPAAAQEGSTTADAAVRAAEDTLRDAVAAKDAEALTAITADDFRALERMPFDRAAWIDEVVRLCGGGRTSVRNLQVVIRDGTAVASYNATVSLEDSCEPATIRTRVADVWTMVNGAWRLTLRTVAPADTPTLEPPRGTVGATPPRPPTLAGSAELTILNTAGNVETFTFGTAGDVAWQHGPWRTNAHGAFLRTTSGGLERGRSIDTQLRQSRGLTRTVELFGRGFYQRDLFAGILSRYGGDAGVGITVVHDNQRLQATFGAGSTHEERLNSPALSDPVGTVGVQYRATLTKSTTITQQELMTWSLQDAGNWRIEDTVAMTTVLRQPLSLRASYTTKYIHQPVPGFTPWDGILSLSLLAKF